MMLGEAFFGDSLEEVGSTTCGFNAGFLGFGQLLDVAIHRVLWGGARR